MNTCTTAMRFTNLMMAAIILTPLLTAGLFILYFGTPDCKPVEATYTSDTGGILHLAPDSTYDLSQPGRGDLCGIYCIIATREGRTACLDLPMSGEIVAFRMSEGYVIDDAGNRWCKE